MSEMGVVMRHSPSLDGYCTEEFSPQKDDESGARLREYEHLFRINTEMYSKDLRDYRIWHVNLFYKGLPIVCDESVFYCNTPSPKKIEWVDSNLYP